VIGPWSPWLEISPDRNIYDPSRLPVFGLLEVKCPQVYTVLDAKCLLRVNERLALKRSHEYFTQIQAQLAVTGLEWCDFYVWCENDAHREEIRFDINFWQDVKDKVDIFFFNYFLATEITDEFHIDGTCQAQDL
jgi:hypothetical protein